MKIYSNGWNRVSKKITKFSPNDLACLSNYIITNLDRSNKIFEPRLKLIKNKLNIIDPIKILEIGAGFGNFCRLCNLHDISKDYTILDIPEMLHFSRYFLEKNNIDCNFIDANKFESLDGEKFDLLVTMDCLSETPKLYREKLIIMLFPNCDSFYSKDGDTADKTWLLFLKKEIKKYYKYSYTDGNVTWICKK